jgi:hypothetical protein
MSARQTRLLHYSLSPAAGSPAASGLALPRLKTIQVLIGFTRAHGQPESRAGGGQLLYRSRGRRSETVTSFMMHTGKPRPGPGPAWAAGPMRVETVTCN